MISAKVIADSKNQFGNRITTMIVTMPRYILAEFNTHRMLSKNSASSRAIPFERNLESVSNNPFVPIAWMKDHKGMQGTEYITNEEDIKLNNDAWIKALENAISSAKYLNHGVKEGRDNGVTKQLCNRLLEPFMWHTVIVTATEWENFFALRCPKYTLETTPEGKKEFRSRKDFSIYETDGGNMIAKHRDEIQWLSINKGQADIHMMATAEAMWDAYNESVPKELKEGEWHIPFGIDVYNLVGYEMDGSEASDEEFQENCIKVATAMCARVSYTVVGQEDKKPDYKADIKLHDRLVESGHWSPFEHCAQAWPSSYTINGLRVSGNFKGFIQYRKTFKNENITK